MDSMDDQTLTITPAIRQTKNQAPQESGLEIGQSDKPEINSTPKQGRRQISGVIPATSRSRVGSLGLIGRSAERPFGGESLLQPPTFHRLPFRRLK